MENKYINLLPASRLRTIRRDYFMRVISIAVLFTALLIIVFGILQVPTYTYLKHETVIQNQKLDSLKAQLATQNVQDTKKRLHDLNTNTIFLTGLSNVPMTSSAIRAALSVNHTGVKILRLTYTATVSKIKGSEKMTLFGTASTRSALQKYKRALQAKSFINRVDLPVDSYAKDTDISFTMTLIGTFQK